MNIITVPGIWSVGRGSTDKLTAPLERFGHKVYELDQEIRSPWDVRSAAKCEHDAMEIVALAQEVNADAVIGHSYGCLKSAIASKYYHFKAMWLFRPAMSRNYQFPDGDTKITCVYSKQDWAVFFGALLRFNHPFGGAGRLGFKDDRITNLRSTGHHSADFTDSMAECWSWVINRDLAAISGE